MEELFYETWREKNGITIMGYQLNRKQLFEMMRDFRLQIEQSHKPVVVRGGAIEAKSFPLEGEALKWTNSSVTQITPTEPLPAEGSAKSVRVGCKNYDFHGSDILRYGRCAYCGNTE